MEFFDYSRQNRKFFFGGHNQASANLDLISANKSIYSQSLLLKIESDNSDIGRQNPYTDKDKSNITKILKIQPNELADNSK